MRVLITNNRLYNRGGASLFVRDLARGLQALGHSVMAYSSDLGDRERLLESDLIPVATDLENLPFRPDIIHAQHHLDAMSALTALLGVPAIYHCHGATWRDCVPKHPRIYRYLAMSKTLAERMAVESNIEPSEIDVFLNGVDVTRFHKVRQLPDKPLRALVFNKTHVENDPTILAIREAVGRCGLELECVGRNFGKTISDPENFLSEYDIVFASGMSAIDAIASGCAVIIIGRTSCGDLVGPENYDWLRQVNFSIAVNSPPPSADKIEQQIRRYNARQSEIVTQRLRDEADSHSFIKNLLGTYEQVIAQHRQTPADLPGEIQATSRYLRRIVPLIKMTDDLQLKAGFSAHRAIQFIDLHAQLSRIEQGLKDVF